MVSTIIKSGGFPGKEDANSRVVIINLPNRVLNTQVAGFIARKMETDLSHRDFSLSRAYCIAVAIEYFSRRML